MPHKHSRRKGDNQESQFNLPPTAIARPLPSFEEIRNAKHTPKAAKPTSKRKFSSSKSYRQDDTPRAFARAMQWQQTGKRPRSGLDDGFTSRPSKQRKGMIAPQSVEASDAEKKDVVKILPGERLADFAARVDQALPVGGLARKGKLTIDGLPERQTKTEKRMHKMYAAWRDEDTRIKERLEEEQENEEEAEEERDAEFGSEAAHFRSGSTKKRRRMVGEQKDDDDDPWAQLKLTRAAPRGLHDVVQAPPTLKPVREKFKTKNGAIVDVSNTPNASGSLKRREELSAARKEVIERYRAMMKK